METTIKTKVPLTSGKMATFTLEGGEVRVLMPVSFTATKFDLDTLKEKVDELVEARNRVAAGQA